MKKIFSKATAIMLSLAFLLCAIPMLSTTVYAVIPAGNLQIIKTSEDGVVANIPFKITGGWLFTDQTVFYTDESGQFTQIAIEEQHPFQTLYRNRRRQRQRLRESL